MELDRVITTFARRYRAALLTQTGMLAALGAAVCGVLGWRLSALTVPLTWAIAVPLALATVGAIGLGWWLRRHWLPPGAVAAHLDERLGLQQRLITAAEFSSAESPPLLYPRLVEDTAQRCIAQQVQLPRRTAAARAVLAVVLLLLLLWPGVQTSDIRQQTAATRPETGDLSPETPDSRQEQQSAISNQQSGDQNQQAAGREQQGSPQQGGQGQQLSDSSEQQTGEKGQSAGQADRQQAEGQGGEQGQQSAISNQQSGDEQQQTTASDQQESASGGGQQQTAGEGQQSAISNQQSGDQQQTAQAGQQQAQGGGAEGSPSQPRSGAAQQQAASQQSGGSRGSAGLGNQQQLKAEIQQLLKDVSGELKQLQDQLAAAKDQPPPQAGTDTDPNLYEAPTPLDGHNGSSLPVQLQTDHAPATAKRPGAGSGTPGQEALQAQPTAEREVAELSAQPLEETPMTRDALPPDYQGVFDQLRQSPSQPSETTP